MSFVTAVIGLLFSSRIESLTVVKLISNPDLKILFATLRSTTKFGRILA
jgi:hypothetical protein